MGASVKGAAHQRRPGAGTIFKNDLQQESLKIFQPDTKTLTHVAQILPRRGGRTNPKIQIPKPNKTLKPKSLGGGLEFGIWGLFGIWDLGFGVFWHPGDSPGCFSITPNC